MHGGKGGKGERLKVDQGGEKRKKIKIRINKSWLVRKVNTVCKVLGWIMFSHFLFVKNKIKEDEVDDILLFFSWFYRNLSVQIMSSW